jgi:hypothetical protein
MTARLMQTTARVAILIEADTRQVIELTAALVTILNALLTIGGAIKPIVTFAADFVEAATFTGKMMGIVVSALAYGFVGVRI